MSKGRAPIRFLLDESVPVGVGTPIKKSGHDVIFHGDVLHSSAPDELVCITAILNGAVLIALDGDMKQFAKKYGTTATTGRFDKLHVLRLCCGEVMASKRLEHAMSFIEHEWAFTLEKRARRLWIDVGPHFLRSNR